jgi:hypothetical protein
MVQRCAASQLSLFAVDLGLVLSPYSEQPMHRCRRSSLFWVTVRQAGSKMLSLTLKS